MDAEMTELVHMIVSDSEKFFFALIAVCVLVGAVTQSTKAVFISLSRERTKREIAAYIAEGALTPEQGERLIRARSTKTNGSAA
tara:strand:- start:249 stop:500 length:252 start_codon:yes stop_codon:yes gene_type:complete